MANRQQQIDSFLLAAHRRALVRLRASPERVDELRAVLDRWRDHGGGSRSDRYLEEWRLLLAKNIDDIERAVCGNGDHATALRSVSPIGVLLSQAERAVLLREARAT